MCYMVTLCKGAILKSAACLMLLAYFYFFTSNTGMTYYHENWMLGTESVRYIHSLSYDIN